MSDPSAGDRAAWRVARNARLALLGLLAIYGVMCLRDPMAGHLIDSVDLAIHETGHLVFRPFGDVIQFAGGTLFQLIVPFTFLVYFLKFAPKRDDFAASVMLWWVAVNLWNIAVYMADARTQALPLVGGGEHDWAYLFGRFGLLQRDTAIAATVRMLGTGLFLAALVRGYLVAVRPPAPADEVDGDSGVR
jgi:hypothetical protein